MQTLDSELLATVVGGESFSQVVSAMQPVLDVPLAQTYGATTAFIRDQAFFHEGVMNAPIGGGKHFRNVPFVGPGLMIKGTATGNTDTFAKGIAVSRATWNAA